MTRAITTTAAMPAPNSQPSDLLAGIGVLGVNVDWLGAAYPKRVDCVGTPVVGVVGVVGFVGAGAKKKPSWPGVVTASRSTAPRSLLTGARPRRVKKSL